jgi:hypothetical protein
MSPSCALQKLWPSSSTFIQTEEVEGNVLLIILFSSSAGNQLPEATIQKALFTLCRSKFI